MNGREKMYRKYQKSNLTARQEITANKELLKESSNDPEKFWKIQKSIYATSGKEGPLCQSFDINGKIVRI